MHLKYRPEIDGLRALAVVAVILFHAELAVGGSQLLPGGYLGVDVFFVISGFLISSIILGEQHREGRFSFAGFYERRARRLLPALLVVALAALPFAWHFLLPDELVKFAKSVLASLAFGSNFFWFFSQQEYAAESALLQPFLHTWSLAVEEQFYLLFPALLLLAVRRWPRHVTLLLVLVAALVLIGAEIIGRRHLEFAFYLLPARLWELLAGAALASGRPVARVAGHATAITRAMPALGLALIVAAMAVPGWQTAYPGLATLLPVAGTALVIAFAGTDLATRLLASRPVVVVGLASYSLYLWHYPIFAFGRHWQPHPGLGDKLAWIGLAFVLSFATWAWIERPFRDRKRVPLRRFALVVGLACVVVSGFCIYWIVGQGFSGRLGYLESVLRTKEVHGTSQGGQLCHGGGRAGRAAFPLSQSCVFDYASASDPRTFILVGDSHAATLAEPMRSFAQVNGYSFVQVTEAGCPHVPGLRPGQVEPGCLERAAQLPAYIRTFPRATVIYSARVPLLLESVRFDNQEGDREANYSTAPASELEAQFKVSAPALRDTLASLGAASERLVIVYPVPEQGFHIGDRLHSWRPAIRSRDDLPMVSTSLAVFRARVRRSYAVLDAVPGANIVRVRPEELFCSDKTGRCVVSEGERIYFAYDNHLSPLGSGMVVARIARQLGLKPPRAEATATAE